MARKKKEEVVEEITETKAQEVQEKVESEGGDMKVTAETKKATKPKKFTDTEKTVTKVNLSEKKEEQPKEEVAKVDLSKKEEEPKQEVVEEIKEEQPKEEVKEEAPVVEEITDEEVEQKVEETKEEVVEAIEKAQDTGEPLPENIQKVVDFMNETGGSLEEYVKLNQDYSSYDENQLLREYYKQTKPHLTDEEISFVMEDRFAFDEEVDEERDVRRKKYST